MVRCRTYRASFAARSVQRRLSVCRSGVVMRGTIPHLDPIMAGGCNAFACSVQAASCFWIRYGLTLAGPVAVLTMPATGWA